MSLTGRSGLRVEKRLPQPSIQSFQAFQTLLWTWNTFYLNSWRSCRSVCGFLYWFQSLFLMMIVAQLEKMAHRNTYTHIHACTHTHAHTCIRTCICSHMYTLTCTHWYMHAQHISVLTHTRLHRLTHIHTHMHRLTHTDTYVHKTCLYSHTHAHTLAYTHTRTHACTHWYTHAQHMSALTHAQTHAYIHTHAHSEFLAVFQCSVQQQMNWVCVHTHRFACAQYFKGLSWLFINIRTKFKLFFRS